MTTLQRDWAGLQDLDRALMDQARLRLDAVRLIVEGEPDDE